jgi:small-conductance mechanosensitive channel
VAIGRLVEGVVSKTRRRPADYRLPRLAHFGFYGVFALFGLISFLVAIGQTPTELFIMTGAGAAVLAFIMQQTLGDLFSGFSLTLERPLRIGDWIRLADGTEGQVQDINWRATHLRKWDNSTFVIPNGKLAQESFTNLHGKHHPYAPWFTVRVSGDHAPSHVIDLIEQAVRSCEVVLAAPKPVVRLMEASVTPYTYMIWVNFANYPTMFAGREELYREINAKLRASGIEIATDTLEVRHREIASAPIMAHGSK